MTRALLLREASTPEGTPGVLVVDGQAWNTLELPWLDNAPKRSCIPDGVYRCAIGSSTTTARAVLGVDMTTVRGAA